MSKKIKTYNRHYESEIKRELQTLVHSNIIHMIKQLTKNTNNNNKKKPLTLILVDSDIVRKTP